MVEKSVFIWRTEFFVWYTLWRLTILALDILYSQFMSHYCKLTKSTSNPPMFPYSFLTLSPQQYLPLFRPERTHRIVWLIFSLSSSSSPPQFLFWRINKPTREERGKTHPPLPQTQSCFVISNLLIWRVTVDSSLWQIGYILIVYTFKRTPTSSGI